jgi:hypothetical protein
MKVTLGELKNSTQALNRLSAIPISAKLSYRLMRITRDASKELELFHQVHIELIKKHGGVESENGNIVVPPERMAEFAPEFNELAQQEAEVYGKPMSIDEFSKVEISANDLMVLSWLIQDPEELQSVQPPAEQPEVSQAPSVN